MTPHFVPDAWREFLDGGHVRTTHIEDIPIWAGFLITQIADLRFQLDDLRDQIGVLLMTQAISLHQMFEGNLDAAKAAFAQLVAANSANKQNAQQMLTQIAALQAQIATGGDPVTATDLSQLNDFAAQIQQAAASTITTTPTASITPPATTAPATPDSGTTTAATSTGAAAPSDTSTAAPAVTVPDATPVPDTTAPTPGTSNVPVVGTSTSWSTPVNASDTGAGA